MAQNIVKYYVCTTQQHYVDVIKEAFPAAIVKQSKDFSDWTKQMSAIFCADVVIVPEAETPPSRHMMLEIGCAFGIGWYRTSLAVIGDPVDEALQHPSVLRYNTIDLFVLHEQERNS